MFDMLEIPEGKITLGVVACAGCGKFHAIIIFSNGQRRASEGFDTEEEAIRATQVTAGLFRALFGDGAVVAAQPAPYTVH